MLNNVFAAWGNAVLISFFSVPPSTNLELALDCAFGLLILLFLFAYEYKFINKIMNEDIVELPDLNIETFGIFFKILPLFIIWQIYFIIIALCGTFICIKINNTSISYIFASIMLCITPFISMIFTEFSKDFKFKKEYFNPFYIFKFLDKTLSDVIILFLDLCIVMIIPACIFYLIFDYAGSIKSETIKLGTYLGTTCLSVYTGFIMKYLYCAGIAHTVKTRFSEKKAID
ncbi:hypothetical protein IJ541_10670 [bacterium]|nr:hypothetical protein [bacterium]